MGWEKVVCWSTKAAISLKHVKTEEKLLWRAYRKSQTLFWTVPSPTPYGLPFAYRLGYATPPQNCNRYYLRDFKFGKYIHRSIRTQAHEKFWRKGSVGVSRDCSNFWVPPIISGTGKATNFKFGTRIYRVHANKSPLKIWEKGERGRIQGLPNFFSVPPIISGTAKATNLTFVHTFLVSIWTNAHYNFREK